MPLQQTLHFFTEVWQPPFFDEPERSRRVRGYGRTRYSAPNHPSALRLLMTPTSQLHKHRLEGLSVRISSTGLRTLIDRISRECPSFRKKGFHTMWTDLESRAAYNGPTTWRRGKKGFFKTTQIGKFVIYTAFAIFLNQHDEDPSERMLDIIGAVPRYRIATRMPITTTATNIFVVGKRGGRI